MGCCVLVRRLVATLPAGLLAALGASLAAAEPAIRFDRDIRPILSDNCYACHGPGTQEAGLRLDSHEAATAELESGARAIRAGDPQASELLARIVATDPDVVMPPQHTNKTLTPEQKDLLTNWIAAGAPYEQHWSFQARSWPDESGILPAARSPPMPADPVTLVWFRHDLRLDDNPALAAAAARGRVVPVFIWAPEEEAPWEPGAASRWWLHHSLEKLAAALAKAGTPLVIRRGPSLAALEGLAREYAATHVAWNRRYEPAVVKRDTTIKKALTAAGLAAESFNGGLLFEPVHVATKEGKPYQVFTPFWRALLARPEPAEPVAAPRKLAAAEPVKGKAKSLAMSDLDLLPEIDWAGTMRKTWSPGEAGAAKRLAAFLEQGLAGYGTGRDRPDRADTSSLSAHLHFGEISPRRIWHAVREAVGGKPAAKITGSPEVYLRELGWREFANHLLYHFPHTAEKPLRPAYATFPWVRDPVGLRAWQRGRTGYPVVDAGMRQLWATGWMHNRVRMIVASFLVKDLRVTWLEGARWFWDTLVDADLAANTLGWQWAAGCGADAAPYFRIFNPTSQGVKFDPDGQYVRQWVPELSRLPTAEIHAPAEASERTLERAGVTLGRDYPEPVVDHAEARKLALEALKQVSRG